MKNHSPILLALLLAASLPVTGCSKEPAVASVSTAQAEPAASTMPTTPTTPPAARDIVPPPASPSDPCTEMKLALEKATFDQHAGLADIQQRMDRDIDAQVSAKKSAGADVSLAVDKKLDTATGDFAEKLRMLTVATQETWDSAKHDTGLALQNVSDAFIEVMSSPPRK